MNGVSVSLTRRVSFLFRVLADGVARFLSAGSDAEEVQTEAEASRQGWTCGESFLQGRRALTSSPEA